MKKNSPIFRGLISACGVALYVLLVAWIMTNAEGMFGPAPMPLGPFLFLLLFVLSAAIAGSLVFGRPIIMYLDGNKKEALATFFYTLLGLAAILIIFLVFIIKSS
ncbi:MAG: hypothetical protein UY56_C0005G0079 [Parcubacteria group bacterium GW2011_GWA1_50_14]|uniref:Uncharacterized protein n=1 Tax=Candidatus Liptonbacteria bacterium GWB1_49_6 TaxID=1798644 RepID=A0A1G2C5W2_9BACT|nr:MAG: hypothetical protein UY56_C0005G0079 [Parcubacteria group bacterium GW2011_GWA1_50_14]OGY96778.1 MAG: hypothetical protein A2122_00845 [Candidatus Liptonbacteria bacterium GWB1_49_6]